MRTMRTRLVTVRFLVAALVAGAMVPAPARAADKVEAKERKARVECAAGNYTEGVRLLAELWVATKDANFLYNQARCYEQCGKNDQAATRFREYLRKATGLPAEEVEAVNRRIDELQGRTAPAPKVIVPYSPAATPAPAQVPAPVVDRSAELVSSPQPAPVIDSPVYARWWFWTGVGAVVVGGVVTAVLLAAHSEQKSPACDQGVPCVH